MKITRTVGIGDVQHVRNQILNVGITSKSNLDNQVSGVCDAARVLGMRARLYILCTQEQESDLQRFLRPIDDFSLWGFAGDSLSQDILDVLELSIELESEEKVTADEVFQGVLNVWEQHGGRFASGNFGRLTAKELREKYL